MAKKRTAMTNFAIEMARKQEKKKEKEPSCHGSYQGHCVQSKAEPVCHSGRGSSGHC